MPQLVQVPNYGEVEFPDDMSDDDIVKAIKKTALGYKEPKSSSGYSIGKPSLENLTSNAATFGKGLIGGAADIGDTLINAASYPLGKAIPAVEQWNQQRNQGLEQFQKENMQDPLYMAGRFGGNVAGTLGVGGAAGNALKVASKTPQALRLAEAIRSGGMTGANLGYKAVGGATQAAIGGALIDPESAPTSAAIGGAIPLVGAALPSLGSGVANLVGGLRTNTGGEPIKAAAKAGFQGGGAQQTLVNNMRGNVPLEDVVNIAERKLGQLGQEASNAYRSGMVNIRNDKSILEFGGVDKALENAFKDVTFKGQVKDARGAQVLGEVNDEIAKWKQLDPAEFHTPEGLDALKQKIGSIVQGLDPVKEKRAKRIGDGIYNAIKGEITEQAPTYAKVMKDYSEGMDEINEIRKTLSVGGKATTDTKLRKLQSVMRNSVNTNYGQRQKLVDQLERGSGDITNAVAGQALNDWVPRGLGKIASVPTAGLAFLGGGLPLAAASLASSSPRLIGEAALKAGQGARYIRDATGKLIPATGAISAGLLNY